MDELRQVWSMLDGGAIMVADVRHQLWRSWGLCRRHGWAFAAMEIECRGGRPFATTVLHEDLIARAARAMRRACRLPWPVGRRLLLERGPCLTCDFIEMVQRAGDNPLAHPGAGWLRAMRPMEGLRRTMALVAATEPVWQRRACPLCLDGGGPLCRPHLLDGPTDHPHHLRSLSALEDLAGRIARFGRSMTWRGPTVGPEERAAWVEGLAWTGGWAGAVDLLR